MVINTYEINTNAGSANGLEKDSNDMNGTVFGGLSSGRRAFP